MKVSLLTVIAVAALAACASPQGPSDPPTGGPVSLKAYMQDSLPLGGYHGDSLQIRFLDSVLSALPGQLSRCAVWADVRATYPILYVLYGSDSLGRADSAKGMLQFPTVKARHARASVEEFFGPNQGVYFTLRPVSGECSDTAASQ